MNNKTIQIGLFGFGTVGQGVYTVLSKTKNAHAAIRRICVRDKNKKRQTAVPDGVLTEIADDIFDDPEISLIVELIDDAGASYEIVTRA